MNLTLLGTGCPVPSLRRRGPSQVVECADALILVDCGAGTMHRLIEAGFGGRSLTHIVFTHLHSDHVTGMLDVLWAGWVRRRPPVICGPPGTRNFVEHLLQAMSYDTRVRGRESGNSFSPVVEEIEEGWKVEGTDWQLATFRVEHLPVDQAFGFRVDQEGASLVISGDTKPCDNLVAHARDVDVLVHEVFWSRGMQESIDAAADQQARARMELLRDYHTSSEEVGLIAAKANARHLVLSHIFTGRVGDRVLDDAPENFIADVSPAYSGTVTVGEDLMTFDIGR